MRRSWLTISWLTLVLSVSLAWAQALSFERVGDDFEVPAGPFQLTIADLNADSNLDVAVAANFSDDAVSVLLGNGDGTLGTAIDYPVDLTPVAIPTGSEPTRIICASRNIPLPTPNWIVTASSVLSGVAMSRI